MTPAIRLAAAADLPAINDLYNHYVLNSTCTYQLDPTSLPDRQAWFARHGPKLPVTVAEIAGTSTLVGWASLTPLMERPAYRFTVEDSIYVHKDYHRRGIGLALLVDILCRADELRYRNVIAIISADQTPSVALHRNLGFAEVGRLPRVGFKFNRWLDVLYMQRENLHFPNPSPAPIPATPGNANLPIGRSFPTPDSSNSSHLRA
jgi:L-amino acid N-acyltransferase